MTIHDLIPIRFEGEVTQVKRAYFHTVVYRAVRRAYKVLTVSQFSKQEIIDWTGVPENHIVVVGNGVGYPFQPTGSTCRLGYDYLLYVGNRRPHKNLQRLFTAFKISGLKDEVRLVVTGLPDASTVAQIKAAGIENAVSFTGVLTDDALACYYRGALALVIPSLYEGFGLPALEAMACAVPVVASRATSLPEVVGDAAILVDPYDEASIADGIRRVVLDSDLRHELREKGLRRAAQFSWDATAQRVWQVLREASELT
jgi:glycosyltransferase involved in cell wall biosynthesis